MSHTHPESSTPDSVSYFKPLGTSRFLSPTSCSWYIHLTNTEQTVRVRNASQNMTLCTAVGRFPDKAKKLGVLYISLLKKKTKNMKWHKYLSATVQGLVFLQSLFTVVYVVHPVKISTTSVILHLYTVFMSWLPLLEVSGSLCLTTRRNGCQARDRYAGQLEPTEKNMVVLATDWWFWSRGCVFSRVF